MMKVKLPWPPTVNTYYTVARGRKILSKRGREYKTETVKMLTALKCMGEAGEFGDVLVRMTIEAFPPDKRRRDLDNILKALKDAMTDANIYDDDNQVKELHLYMRENTKPGYVTIEINAINDEELTNHYKLGEPKCLK